MVGEQGAELESCTYIRNAPRSDESILFRTFIRSPRRLPRTVEVRILQSRDVEPGNALSDTASSCWTCATGSGDK